MHDAHIFMLGMLVALCGVVGAFFMKFFRRTHDRLFLAFAIAFWMLGLNWLLLAFTRRDERGDAILYLIRLAAFVLILIAILDKNRSKHTS